MYVIAVQSKKLLLLHTESRRGNQADEQENTEDGDLSAEDSIFFSTILILFSVVFMTIYFASKNRWYMRGLLKMLF